MKSLPASLLIAETRSEAPARRGIGRRSPPAHGWWRAVLFAMLLSFATPPFQRSLLALDIEQVQWGFDGQVVLHRFNLLSLLVSNTTPQPFEGRLELRKTVNAQMVDAPLVEEVYLAPHSSRWVQFHTYNKLDWEEWIVAWGPTPSGRFALTKPRAGKPACVLLEETDTLATGQVALKRFPETLFPAYLTAADGLQGVVLDHVPRWEEARQRAFVEWLNQGGRVHLLHMPRKEFPQFSGILRVLNTSASRERVGAGYVYRHARERRDLDPAYIETAIVAGRDPALAIGTPLVNPSAASAKAEDDEQNELFRYMWEGDDTLLNALKKMSRPEHSWAIIHLMSLSYILLIFPGCFVIARKRSGDYRYVFGVLIAIVAGFSLSFLAVGRRGYGERTAVHSLAIAHVLGDGSYDVTQWSNAFVVDGGDFEFSHAGTGRMYSTCQDEEQVRRQISNGSNAHFVADMPPFSSRAFGHRLILNAPSAPGGRKPSDKKPAEEDSAPGEGPIPLLRLVEWETQMETMPAEFVSQRDLTVETRPSQPERVLKKLVLAAGPGRPPEFFHANVLFGRRVYSLVDLGDRLEMKAESATLATFLHPNHQQPGASYFDQWTELEGTPDKLFELLYRPLLARACNVNGLRDARKFSLPEDRLRLVLYAPMPPEFFVKNPNFESQNGMVLYCLDIFPPDSR